MRLAYSLLSCLLLATASSGCGKIPDASGDDDDDMMMVDAAPMPDAPPAMGDAVLVAFHDDGSPVAGAMAVVTRPDGTLVSMPATDATGRVTVQVTDGDVVHIGWNEGDATDIEKKLFTVVAIAPGDEIEINRNPNSVDQNLGSTNVTFAGTPPTGTTRIYLTNGCDERQLMGQLGVQMLQVSTRCLDGQNRTSVVATARDNTDRLLGYTSVLDIPFSPGGSITLPAWTQGNGVAVTVSAGDPPQGGVLTRIEATSFRNGDDFENLEVVPMNGETEKSFNFAPGYAQHIQAVAALAFTSGGVTDGVVFAGRRAAGSTTTFDLQPGALPRFHMAVWSPGASGAHGFSWSVSGSTEQKANLSGGDLMVIQFGWSEGIIGSGRWVIMMPPDGNRTELELDLHGLRGQVPDQAMIQSSFLVIMAIRTDILDGYGQLKNDFGTSFLESGLDGAPTWDAQIAFSGQGGG